MNKGEVKTTQLSSIPTVTISITFKCTFVYMCIYICLLLCAVILRRQVAAVTHRASGPSEFRNGLLPADRQFLALGQEGHGREAAEDHLSQV